MRSNAGMANRKGDVDLRFAQVSAPSQNFGLAWLGSDHSTLASRGEHIKPRRASSEEARRISQIRHSKIGIPASHITSRDSHRYPAEGVIVAGTIGVTVVGATEGVTLSAWHLRSNFVVTFPKGVTSKLTNITSTLYDYLTLINIVYVCTVTDITNKSLQYPTHLFILHNGRVP
jgi:hypothetical protein